MELPQPQSLSPINGIHEQMKSKDKQVNKNEKRSFLKNTMVLKAIAGIPALVAVLFPFYSYVYTRDLEAKRPILELQFELYEEAVRVASRISTVECKIGDDDCIDTYAKDCRHFFDLYWGQLAVVEDKQVEWAMIEFRKTFKQEHQHLCAPDHIEEIATKPKPEALPRASLDLAWCVNASLQRSWNVELLPNKCNFDPMPSRWEKLLSWAGIRPGK